MVTLTLMHVWAHTVTRYATGKTPLQFSIYFGHGDIVPMLLLWLLLLVSAVWLASGLLLALLSLARGRRLPRPMICKEVILLVALGLPFVPVQVWDEILFATVGPGKTGGGLLAQTAGRGDTARLRNLLDSGIPVDSPNLARTTERNALVEAVRMHQADAVALLLERGADPNRYGFYGKPLQYAVTNGDAAIVRLLLKHGADPCISVVRYNQNGRSEASLQEVARDPAVLAILPACNASAVK
jgi:hypothetical protein